MTKPQSINTIVFSTSANEAEELVSQLKNQGLAIRHQLVDNSETLSKVLQTKTWQLAIFLEELIYLPTTQALSMLNQQKSALPAVFLCANYSIAKRKEIMQQGLFDCIPDTEPELLALIIKRDQRMVSSEIAQLAADKLVTETSKRNKLLLNSSKDAIAYIADGMHIYTNPTYSERFKYDEDDLIALTIMDLVSAEDSQKIKDLFKKQKETGEEIEETIRGLCQDGTDFEANFIISSAIYDDEECHQLLVREIADDAELLEKLKEVSSIDHITGLLNRPSMLKKMSAALESSGETGIDAILYFISIDNMQDYQNDFGITACDDLLQGVANWLKQNTPENAHKARINDSSFGVLLTDSEALPSELARSLCDGIKKTSFDVAGQTVNVTFSVGTVTTSDSDLEAGKLLAQANAFCNKVSADGGDGFKIFNPAVDSLLSDKEKHIHDEFLMAKDAGNIRAIYQPMMALKGSSNRQYLSFFRYLNEKDELILGDGIFDIFEKLGVDAEIDRLSIKAALSEMTESGRDKRLKLFVKLSPGSLVSEDLIEWLLNKIESTGIETSQLVLCIEAQVAHSYLNRVQLLSDALKKCNVGLCINSVATEDSSLVEQLKPNYLTLHDGFLDMIKEEGTEKVLTLTNMASENQIMTVVTKLEDASTLAQIWPLGIDFAMGNYVSKPLKAMSYDFTENDF